MTTPTLREGGLPSPLHEGTFEADGLVPPFPFEAAVAGQPELGEVMLDPFLLGDGAPGWMSSAARAIRPLCIGALMAIPTIGAATVGTVALFSGPAAERMVRASIGFLGGLPTDIMVLIGVLSTGYGFARTVEKLRGSVR